MNTLDSEHRSRTYSEITTKELLEILKEFGISISAKLLADYAQRGFIPSPKRRGKKGGGRGSESFWDSNCIERVRAIHQLRKEGVPYRAIAQRLDPNDEGLSRLSPTIWLPKRQARELTECSKEIGIPVVSLLQKGAELFNQFPDQFRRTPVFRYMKTIDEFDLPELSPTERIFYEWGKFACIYANVKAKIRSKQLPVGLYENAYVFWRIIQERDSALSLDFFGFEEEEIERDGKVVAKLTTYSGQLRLLKPIENTGLDDSLNKAANLSEQEGSNIENPNTDGVISFYRELAKELNAVLISEKGDDFNHSGGAQALAQLANWLNAEGQNG